MNTYWVVTSWRAGKKSVANLMNRREMEKFVVSLLKEVRGIEEDVVGNEAPPIESFEVARLEILEEGVVEDVVATFLEEMFRQEDAAGK